MYWSDYMKKIKIATPENIEVEYTLADIGSRIAATIIDMLIQCLIIAILFIGVLLIRHFSKELWDQHYGWIVGISLLIYALVSYGYYIIMELTMNGKTLGKKVFKLRTIRNNGQPITMKHSAIRNLFKVFLDMQGIGIVFMFFTKQHKRIGDFAASTIVVMEKAEIQPITLDNLDDISASLKAYISDEEYELVREYLQRKNIMDDRSKIQQELKSYFTNKFEKLEILNEGQRFIDQL
jgi:uncharacterized RDD family membrane protein YckC